MTLDRAKAVADAVLYEGYILYPYRASATKNRHRWTPGGLFPKDYESFGEASSFRAEALVEADDASEIDLLARFLHTQSRRVCRVSAGAGSSETARYEPLDSLEADGRRYISFDEAVERRVEIATIAIDDILDAPKRIAFSFPETREIEAIHASDDRLIGGVVRRCAALQGVIEIGATRIGEALFRLSVTIENVTPLAEAATVSRIEAQSFAFLSAHLISSVRGGRFVSLLEPPEALRPAVEDCVNRGVWPVLIGADAMLASPIILYDQPEIAPESRAQFFDGAEIDELLTLRVLTLTDEEKREMAAADPRAKDILERCEGLTKEQLGALHGAFRPPPTAGGGDFGLAIGGRVRLAPNGRGDVMDSALAGQIAVVERIDLDLEGRAHVAVTLLDDPGADLGAGGFPGHRFYFSPQELEPIADEGTS